MSDRPGAATSEAVEAIRRRMQEVVDRHGPWTSHRIELAEGLATWTGADPHPPRLATMDRLLALAGYGDLRGARVLDLGCREGLFALHLARRGAETLGLEARAGHVGRARFAAQALRLERCRFQEADVRRFPEGLGQFDVVLCVGLLYHLDFPDNIRLLETIRAHCRGHLILDTHVAPALERTRVGPPEAPWVFSPALETREFGGARYQGRGYREHAPGDSDEVKRSHSGSSVDNDVSFWLTQDSLVSALSRSGMRILHLAYPDTWSVEACRVWILAEAHEGDWLPLA